MHRIDAYLAKAMEKRASDLHLAAEEPVRARVDGDLEPLTTEPLSAKDVHDMLNEILTPAERERFLQAKNLDKSYFNPQVGSFRVNIFFTRKGVSAVLRTIPTKIPSMEDLGLPPVLKELAELPKGLILVTGPTGSGKSTTLAAMIDYLNRGFPLHILTAEDPVEFVHPSKKSLVNQREIGQSCPSFADALKYALREDPDVILIGEMRDLETIALALTAAETGHLVFGTLHTRGAAASVDRIIDSFPSSQQAMIRTMLSESLAAVVSQTLIKRADKKGRVAAYEIMVVTHAIANLIREGKTFQIEGAIQTGRKEGMVLMEQSVRDLLQKGLITKEDAAPFMVTAAFQKDSKPELAKPGPASAKTPAPATAAKGPSAAPIAAKPPAPAPLAASAPQASPLTPPPPKGIPLVPKISEIATALPMEDTSTGLISDLTSEVAVEDWTEKEEREEVLDIQDSLERMNPVPAGPPAVEAPTVKAVPPIPKPPPMNKPVGASAVKAPPPLPKKKAG